jgi:hypothetical protein
MKINELDKIDLLKEAEITARAKGQKVTEKNLSSITGLSEKTVRKYRKMQENAE